MEKLLIIDSEMWFKVKAGRPFKIVPIIVQSGLELTVFPVLLKKLKEANLYSICSEELTAS